MPFFTVEGEIFTGWESIIQEINAKIHNSSANRFVLVVECYQGVYHNELIESFMKLNPELFVNSGDAFLSDERIREITYPDVTDDAIFGYITRLTYDKLLDKAKVEDVRNKIKESSGLVIVYGHAAALIEEEPDCLVYADMSRWEIQLRQRKNEISNLGINNADEAPGLQQIKNGAIFLLLLHGESLKRVL